jgi:hyperosmotically inducible protein
MKNFTKTVLLAAIVIVGLTACQNMQHSSDERSQGRQVDDHRIAAQIKHELAREPVYKFNDVDVKAFNGVVQLSGFVNTDEQKRRAEEIARHADGATQIENAISLKPQAPTPTGRTYQNNTFQTNSSSSYK